MLSWWSLIAVFVELEACFEFVVVLVDMIVLVAEVDLFESVVVVEAAVAVEVVDLGCRCFSYIQSELLAKEY